MNTVSALNSLQDEQLLELIAKRRDKLALAELYDRYRHSLGSFVRRKVYQDRLVDEIYNDVMMTIWQKADGFRGDSKVSTWIFGVAHRICMSHSRKEMKHTKNTSEVEIDVLDTQPNQVEAESEADSELIDQLRRATAKLKDNHREVIELTYFHGHSLIEIAEIVGCPVNTVKTRLFHARQHLKNKVEKQIVNG